MESYLLHSENFSTHWSHANLAHAIVPHVVASFETGGLSPAYGGHSGQWDRSIITLLLLLTPFVLTYPVTLLKSKAALSVHEDGKKPALVPYWIPLVGHVVSYLLDAARLASAIT